MEKRLLEYINPYIFHDNKILQKDFNIIFKDFTDDEMLQVYEFLNIKKIEIHIDSSDYKVINSNKALKISNEKLCFLYQEGDEKALDLLISKNERLVYSRVMKYYKMHKHSLSIDDLFQEGCIGIIKASKKFDISLGYKFSTYATNWIDQGIARAIADKGFTIRVPVHMFDTINKYRRVYRELELEDLDDKERLQSLIDNTGLKLGEIEDINNIARNILNISSLNIKIGNGEDTELISFLTSNREKNPMEIVIDSFLGINIENALLVLTNREREIINLRFGLRDNEPRTLEDIGSIYNLTRERIRQIEKAALTKLRLSKESKKLKSFLYE